MTPSGFTDPIPKNRSRPRRAVERMPPVVVLADAFVDFEHLRAEMGIDAVRLATEQELGRLLPESELGAMPPFGEPWPPFAEKRGHREPKPVSLLDWLN